MRKVNFYLLTLGKIAKFSIQKFVIFNMITEFFLVEKWGPLERGRRYGCKNLLNLDYEDGIRSAIYQAAYK